MGFPIIERFVGPFMEEVKNTCYWSPMLHRIN